MNNTKKYIEFCVPINLEKVNDSKYLKSILLHINVLKAFGWNGCVLDYRIDNDNYSNLKKYIEVFPKLIETLKTKLLDKENEIKTTIKIPMEDNPFVKPEFKLYKRFTIVSNIKNFQSVFVARKNKVFDFLDVFALEPQEESHLINAVKNMNFDCISITKIPSIIYLRRQIIMALKKNILIEMKYNKAISDNSSFYSFFTKFSSSIRATKGKQCLVFSNGTTNVRYIRSPKDVANMAQLFGLDYSIGQKLISDHIFRVLEHGEERKLICGAIRITEKDFEEIQKFDEDTKMEDKKDDDRKRKREEK